MKPLVLFFTLFFGFYLGLSQSITITSPNGGEVWAGCSTKNITWTSSSTSNFYSIDYSTDGGLNWTSVTSSYNTTSGSFSWTVPNINSSNCLVRVQDSQTPAVQDQSDTNFTITAPLILTSPNGGETWEAGTSKSITWAATGTSNRYKIEYTTNGGSSWNTITNNVYNTTGIYSWTVQNSPSNAAQIRVTDYYTSCMSDKSDSLFTIDPPTPTLNLTYPNGGQILYSGKAYNITWSSSNLTSSLIALDYSTDSGNTWTPIVTGVSNTGSHSWTVPNTPSTSCLVKVKAVGTTYKDSSNAYFTIKEPFISVFYPNGGESWGACNAYTIQWSHNGTTNSRFNIAYSTDQGVNWTNIVTNLYRSSTSNSTYSWTIPGTVSGQALIRVTDYNNSNTKDQSDTNFTIAPNSDIIVTSPVGGEDWEAGTTKSITWVDNNISRFRVRYSSNNGSSYSYITTSTYANSHNWTVPNNPGSSYLVKVEDYYNTCKFDESDSVFTVSPPTPVINVTYPNGQTFYPLQSVNISWTSAYLTSAFVAIDFSSDSGATWTSVTTVTNDDGSHSYTLPNVVSSNCFFRVSEYGNSSQYDWSNPFTIASPFITLTAPNGGEVWKGCESKTISWSVGGGSNSYRLDYSLDSGATWTFITTRSGSSYNWSIPAKLSSSKALIRVRDLSRSMGDTSNSTLSFIPNTDIIVTAPVGGEQWEAGTSKSITWVDNNVSRFRVRYSSNSGSSYSYITTSTYANAHSWTVPNNPGNNYLIRVEDYYNSCKYDESDSVFSVTPPTPVITVTSPNGTYYPLQSVTIAWTSAYLNSAFVNIDFSSDSGSTWASIVSNTSNDGSHSWTIPDSVSSNCFVRVTEVGSPTVYDWSNRFTIASPFITLNAPNGGEVWKGCESKTISWSVGGGSNSYRLDYSLDSGATWSFIATRSGSSYNWTIPAKLSSSKALVRIRDISRNMGDTSNAVFTLNPNNDIIVTSPVGGEDWEAGTTKSITWVDNNISRFRVRYSSNNGSSYSYITTSTYANSHNWTVPNNPGSSYLVKVEDYYNTCKFDESDSVFTVSPPTPVINVTYPNGQTFYPLQSVNISWTSAYLTSAFVAIDFSSDSGATWTSVTTVTNDDGSHSYTLPNVVSSNCFFRVSEYGNSSQYDWSNPFTIASPFITLTAPNGGEVWKGCESKTISWSVGGGSNSYRLDYSLDSGATWTFITTRSGSSYNWSIPAKLSSSKALIRVRDLSRSMGDTSNSTLSFIPNTDIIVTAPVGGEQWEAGTSKSITWVDNNVSRFRVRYSSNSGSSYSYITTSTYANAHSWTVPNNPGNNYLIRVEDYYNSCKYDESDSVFSVTPPTPVITVTSPNGTYYPLQSVTIAWTSAYLNSAFVNIDFSSDSGSTWASIVSNTSNDGSHSWTIPDSVSSNCFVRVTEVGSPTVYDWSNRFTIASPFITLNAPNGGEVWKGCESKTISWSVGGGSNSYRLDYSLDSGATWSFIATRSGSSYNWTIPAKLSSSKALVRIRDISRNMGDTSNAVFTLNPNNDIIVTSPVGGEDWEAGTTKSITWVDNNISRFRVRYSSNNGSSYSYITTSTYANSHNWTVPNNPGSSYLVKVEDYYNTCKFDESDSVFAVTPPTPNITVTYPNTNLSFYQGQSRNITWSSAYLSSPYVRIDYSLDSGLTWYTVANVTNNDGSHTWSVPFVSTTKGLIRVMEYGNTSVYDISNTTFSIQPSIVLTAPNGGSLVDYRGCTVTSIKWDAGGTSYRYRIEYSLNGGSSWTVLNSNYYNTSSSPVFNWTMPNTASSNVLVRVSDRNDLSKTDMSDQSFSISAPIILHTPNLGGTYHVGDTVYINWISNGTSNYYNIDFSSNGGTTWSSVAFNHNTSGNSYQWIVPNTLSSNCLIRITDNINSCKKTQSAVPFSIANPSRVISLNSPSGGETWAGCSSQTISWSDTASSASYHIEYSNNSGQSWNTISVNASGSSYTWTTPSSSGSNYLIRVSDATDSTVTDQSDSVFSITTTSKPIVSAIGGNTILCSGSSVQLIVDRTGGLTWYPGGTTGDTLSVSTAGNYYVLFTDSNGCSIQSDPVAITNGTIPTAPTISASGSTQFCLGGSVVLSTDKTSDIEWFPGGQTSQTITATQAGTYTVTYAPAGSCPVTSSPLALTTNPRPVIFRSSAGACIGDTLTLTSSSNTGNLWTPTGDTSSSIQVINNGNYTLQVTDSNGCTANSATDTVVFTPNPSAPTITASGALTFCRGGSVTLSANPPANITWSTGIQDSTLTVDTAITVTATYTANSGCEATSNPVTTSFLPAPAIPLISLIGDSVMCQGDSVELVSNSSNTNVWSTGDTASSIVVDASGSYSVTTIGTNGCTSQSTSQLIVVNPVSSSPSISANGPTTFCLGDSVLLISSQSSGNLWSTGDSSSSIMVYSSGSYTVQYANQHGCISESSPALITVLSAPVKPSITNTGNLTFCNGDSVVLTSSYSGSNLWSNGDTTRSTVVRSSGSFTVTAENSSGCTTESDPKTTTVLNVPTTPSITRSVPGSLCAGDTLLLSSSSASDNVWSTGDSTSSITVVSSGTYSLKRVGANGCESAEVSTVVMFNNNPPVPTITAGGTTTFCQGDSVTLQSSSTMGNLWSTGETAQTIVVNSTGTIGLSVSNSNGCSSDASAVSISVLANPAIPVISVIGSPTYCQGDTIQLQSSYASGNVWSNGSTDQTISVVNSGSFSVTYTDSSGCSNQSLAKSITVNPSPSTPSISTSGSTTFCSGGSVTLTSSAALGNMWSNGDTTTSINVSIGGQYSLDVTNQFNCTASSVPVSITVHALPNDPVVSMVGDTIFCQGDSSTLEVTNYSSGLLWSSGSTDSIITVTASGNYSVIYLDSNSCSATSQAIQITVNTNPATPTISASGPLSFCDGNNVVLTSSSASGNSWSNGATTSSITVSGTGSHDVTVTNSSNCSSTSSTVFVTVHALPANPVVSVIGDTVFCQGDSITLSVSNYSSNLSWSNGDSTTQITVYNTGTSTVTHTDTNGCSSTSRTISILANANPPTPVISTNGPTSFCSGGSVTLTSSSASNNVWSTGDSTSSIVVSSSGLYSVEVSNQHNCSSSSQGRSVDVWALPASPLVSILGDTVFCNGDSLTLVATNHSSGLTWSTNDTSGSIVVRNSGIYSVSKTDSNGCASTSRNIGVTVNPIPFLPIITASGPTNFCDGDSIRLSSSSAVNNAWSTGDSTNTIVVSGSGLYELLVYNQFGCSNASSPTQVNVTALPAKPSIIANGGTEFCQGDSSLLVSSISSGNIWSTGDSGLTITVNSSGTYTLQTLANGCLSPKETVFIKVNPNPSTPLISMVGDTTFCVGDSIVLRSSYITGNVWSSGEASSELVVRTGSTYHVTYSDTNGCSTRSASISTFNYAVPQSPVIFPGGQIEICDGDTVQLQSDISDGIRWNSNASPFDTLMVSDSGSYFVERTDSNGCKVLSNTVMVDLLPKPVKPIVTKVKNQLESTTADAYQWMFGGSSIQGEIGQIIRPSQNGNYQVEIADANNCKSISTPFSFFSVGEHEMTNLESFVVYPNPSGGSFNIEMSLSRLTPLNIHIYGVDGKMVHGESIQPSDHFVGRAYSFEDLAPGMYMIEVEAEGKVFKEKITIY